MRAVLISLFFSAPTLIQAEDYPSGYLGPGYREYLSNKVQNGYYVETFTKIDMSQKERVNKRNQIEQILGFSSQAMPESSYTIYTREAEHRDESDNLRTEIDKQRQQREKTASAEGEFSYISYSDGKKDFFKDGLLSRTDNERLVDEYGNVSLKNTRNMRYNDNRLLIGYEATLKDNLGNTSQLDWFGATYTADSLFYGNYETNANKNLVEYYLKETDSAGNVKLTHFDGANFEGKLLRAFHQRIEDSIYGTADFTRSDIKYENGNSKHISAYHEEGIGTDNLAYTLDRNNITYAAKDQLAGYHEEAYVTQIDGLKSKTISDVLFKYLSVETPFGADAEADPDRLLESIVTTTVENPDGSKRTENTTTKYDYDSDKTLIGATAKGDFNGQEKKWWEDNTLKDGHTYSGSQEIQYEILYGKPMTKQTDSAVSYYHCDNGQLLRTEKTSRTHINGLVNSLQRLINTQEHTEITSILADGQGNPQNNIRDITNTYAYLANGNLSDVVGEGTGRGYEFNNYEWKEYLSDIRVDYEVILGQPHLQTDTETKAY